MKFRLVWSTAAETTTPKVGGGREVERMWKGGSPLLDGGGRVQLVVAVVCGHPLWEDKKPNSSDNCFINHSPQNSNLKKKN